MNYPLEHTFDVYTHGYSLLTHTVRAYSYLKACKTVWYTTQRHIPEAFIAS